MSNSNYQKAMDFIHTKSNTQFYLDLIDEAKVIEVNGRPMSLGVWNLICSNRELTIYIKGGLKPHRGWKVTNVKKYFGLKGSGEKLLEDFLEIKKNIDIIRKGKVGEEKTDS